MTPSNVPTVRGSPPAPENSRLSWVSLAMAEAKAQGVVVSMVHEFWETLAVLFLFKKNMSPAVMKGSPGWYCESPLAAQKSKAFNEITPINTWSKPLKAAILSHIVGNSDAKNIFVYYIYMYYIFIYLPMNHVLMESPPEIFRKNNEIHRFLRVDGRISRTKVPFGWWISRRFKDKALHGDDQGGHGRANQGGFLRRCGDPKEHNDFCLGCTGRQMNHCLDIYVIYSVQWYIANA